MVSEGCQSRWGEMRETDAQHTFPVTSTGPDYSLVRFPVPCAECSSPWHQWEQGFSLSALEFEVYLHIEKTVLILCTTPCVLCVRTPKESALK